MTRFKIDSSYKVRAPIELVTSRVEKVKIPGHRDPKKIGYKLKYHLRPDVLEWLEKHFGQDTDKLSNILSNWNRMLVDPDTNEMVLVVAFQDEQDAILFKLTWC